MGSRGSLRIDQQAIGGRRGIADGAALELEGGIAVGAEALTLNGTGIALGGALRNISDNNSWAGTVTLGSASSINTDSGTLTISGGITNGANTLTVGGAGDTTIAGVIGSGAGGLTKNGAGTLTLGATNTYTGINTIQAGTISISTDRNLGAVPGSPTPASITFNGAVVTLKTTAGFTLAANRGMTLTTDGIIDTTAGILTYGGVITGGGGLTKASAGTLILSGTNTYAGATIISAGVINIQNASALGTDDAGTTVSATGAALEIQGDITGVAEAIILNGTGILNAGALRNVSGANSISGAITLASAVSIGVDAGTLTLSGAIDCADFDLTFNGAGATVFSGSVSNVNNLTVGASATVTTTSSFIIPGIFTVNSGGSFSASSGTITMNDGSSTVNSGGTIIFYNLTMALLARSTRPRYLSLGYAIALYLRSQRPSSLIFLPILPAFLPGLFRTAPS